MGNTKLCQGCNQVKDYSDYYKDSSKSNGIMSRCVACKCSRRIAYYYENQTEEIGRVRKWSKNNKDTVRSYTKAYYSTPKGRAKKSAARRLREEEAVRLRTPTWLTKEHHNEIEEYYLLANELAWLNQDGKPFEVDHIIPLRGEDVSGLHVPWNIQLLSADENRIKSNRFTLIDGPRAIGSCVES